MAESSLNNPFAPPTARVQDVHDTGATQPIKVLSAKGRMGRLRYIGWTMLGSLAIMVPMFLAGLVAGITGSQSIVVAAAVLAYAAYFVFFGLITIQRCHDMDWSGWAWLVVFIPLVGLLFWFVPGTQGANRFGAPPPPNRRGMGWIVAIPAFLFVLGILAAIALPAYQSYTERARAAQTR
jgi:uncharacterized membrane protein YhaH (DUF805 family)